MIAELMPIEGDPPDQLNHLGPKPFSPEILAERWDCSAEKVVKQFSVFAAHGTAAQPSFGGGGGCCGGSCGCGH